MALILRLNVLAQASRRVLCASRASSAFLSSRFATSAADEDAASSDSAAWYSPESLERRLSMEKKKKGDKGRTKPPLSEEDHWYASGAPGYADVSSPPHTVIPSAAATTHEQPTTATTSHNDVATNTRLGLEYSGEDTGNRLFAQDPSHFPYVRRSVSQVSAPQLPSFIRTYELLVKPVYNRLEGCVSAELLLGDVPAAASPATICGACFAPFNAKNQITVISTTVWKDESSCNNAAHDSEYATAMRQLSSYFKGDVKVEVFRKAV